LWYIVCYGNYDNILNHSTATTSQEINSMKRNRRLLALGLAGAAYALRNQSRLSDQVKAYRAVGEWDYRAKAGYRQRSLKRRIGGFVVGAVGRSLMRRFRGR
jgi:hypothetical protein